jgi:outer membrane lipopolysaccharide assembly protein LptE/RlpB
MNLPASGLAPRRAVGLLSLLILLLTAQLAGCGFEPRGAAISRLDDLPQPLHIAGLARFSDLYRELDRQLAAADVEMTGDPAGSGSTLVVSRWDQGSRVLSVDSRNKAVEFEIDELVTFALRSATGEELLPARTERVLRIQYRPPTSVLGASRESELLRKDMRRELVGRILRRLAALN